MVAGWTRALARGREGWAVKQVQATGGRARSRRGYLDSLDLASAGSVMLGTVTVLAAWKVQVQRRQLWLLLAVGTHKVEVVLFGVLLVDAVALRVLPDVALFTRNAVRAVVVVLPMFAAHCAVKHPFAFFFGQLLQLFLPSFHLGLEVALRQAALNLDSLLQILVVFFELA